MKNLLVKIALAGVVLASALPAASAATRHQMRSNADNGDYSVTAQSSQTGWNSRWTDDEQARRDIESAGG